MATIETTTVTDRKTIAIATLALAIILMILISAAFIFYGGSSEKQGDASEKLFLTMIPLVGTWIGTVLAYYFSGESFQRATDSVTRIASQVAEERLHATNVSEAMIPIEYSTNISLEATDPRGEKVPLEKGLINKLNERITRLPILDSEQRVCFILHESAIYRFTTDKALEASQRQEPLNIEDLTLHNLLEHGDMRNFASRTIAFVSKDSTLAEAKRQMESLRKCQDVFITEDGSPDAQAIGWITNVIISRHARA